MDIKVQPTPINLQPRPQKIQCEKNSGKEAKFVVMPYNTPPSFASKKHLEKLQKEDKNVLFFNIDDVFDDWMQVYQNFRKDEYCNLNYYCKYIIDQNFKLQDKEIDNLIDELQDLIIEQLDELRDTLKEKLAEHKKYYSLNVENYKEPYNTIKKQYESFKDSLSKVQSNNQDQMKKLKSTLQQFVEEATSIQRKEVFEKDEIVKYTNDLKKSQPLYINSNIWAHYKQKITNSINELKNTYISNNSFKETQIPDKGYIFQVFQRIKCDQIFSDKPQLLKHELTDKLISLFKCPKNSLRQNLQEKKGNFKDTPLIALMKTSTDQSIGFYYNPKQKNKSLLFSLTKNMILPVKKEVEIRIGENENEALAFGNDLVLTSDFKGCSSTLGDVFDLKGEQIGNLDTYLANGFRFDIEYFELYHIDDPDLSKPSIQQPSIQFPPPNIGPFKPPVRSTFIPEPK